MLLVCCCSMVMSALCSKHINLRLCANPPHSIGLVGLKVGPVYAPRRGSISMGIDKSQ